MDHAEASSQEPAAGGIPVIPVTIDQVVALNLRYWRRAAGMTQEEVGARLGWSPANVSSAERSRDGEQERRRFNAQTLAEMALALGVPVSAFFLPPPDDGTGARYQFTARGRHCGMGDLMAFVASPDTDDETPVMDAYRDRFNEAAHRYLEPEQAAMVGRLLNGSSSPQALADTAARLRDERPGLLRVARLLGELADAISAAPEGTP